MKDIHSAFFISLLIILISSRNTVPQSIHGENNLNLYEKNIFIRFDTLEKKSSSSIKFLMRKDPLKAVLYSAILPGAGQFYNESYWKIPIIAGLGGYFVYEIIKNNNSFLDYRDQYINSQTQQNPNGDPRLKTLREFYRDQRDDFFIYSAILYVVNLIDAYVDAQLYDFDVSDKVKLKLLNRDKLIKISFAL